MNKNKNFEIKDHEAISHERVKELSAINTTVNLIKEGKSIDETLQKIAHLLPYAWQYPESAKARIVFNGKIWLSDSNFKTSEWAQSQYFQTIDGKSGCVDVFYDKKYPDEYEGPFLEEERNLLNNITNIISSYINSEKGKALITAGGVGDEREGQREEEEDKGEMGLHLMHRFLRKINADRDVYHDLMPFKVKEILLVATLYNAFNLELEGSFSNDIFSEYHHQNLTSIPRITGVSTYNEAIDKLNYKHFDLIIIMIGVDKKTPFELCEKIKSRYSYIPVYLLLNDDHEIELIQNYPDVKNLFNRIFTWNGDSKVFFAMVKHLEDAMNVQNDTKIGLVSTILVIEDSPKYYSKYLPIMYDNILSQTKKIIEEVSSDEIYKLYRLRSRPKILLANNIEEARFYYNQYRDYILCVVSDVELEESGKGDQQGIDFIREVKKTDPRLPVIFNSSENMYQEKAFDLNALFINKNSDSLVDDINSFINHHLNLGSFVYKTPKGKEIAKADNLKDFEEIIHVIPDESLVYHARKGHFFFWLKARGAIEIAKKIHNVHPDSFDSVSDYRDFLINSISKNRYEKEKGKVVEFEKKALRTNANIVSLNSGLLGGKGRGLAFINTLINNLDFSEIFEDINVTIPLTMVIGSDEFDSFIKRNELNIADFEELDDDEIKKRFIDGRLSDKLLKRLRILVNQIRKPLAFRSSGLLEDSIKQPFAGIFETYLLPNSDENETARLKQAADAVKMVFASVYEKVARNYIRAIDSNFQGERMAVVVQEVVGSQFGDYFYPHISGVAQSYNYYPVSHMKPEDGFAIIAAGLGKYVVEGEKTFRFSPKHPKIDAVSLKDQYENSQTELYSIDLSKRNVNLLEGENAGLKRIDIYDAEKHGSLKHLASVYDPDNETITSGLAKQGPRVMNFADILKHNYVPLAETIDKVLSIAQEGLGCSSEIEFAVDLSKDKEGKSTFYLLQIKPLVTHINENTLDMDEINKDDILLYAEKGMGNGVIEGINDVIYIPPENFDKMKTEEMAQEIEIFNEKMRAENKKYVLIGPGRWGTRDKFIGIPVEWAQISNAKTIVEYSMEDFPLDASLGSHFFHNVTANGIGYFSVHHYSKSYIEWEKLNKLNCIKEGAFFKHIRYNKELFISIDGKEGIAVITK